MEKLEPLHTIGVNAKWCSYHIFKELKMELPHDLKRIKSMVRDTYICTPCSLQHYLQWLKDGSNSSYLSITNWTDKMWYIHMMKCCCCYWFQSLSSVWLFCNPMYCSPPGSSVHRISQSRIPDWVATSFSRGSSEPKDQNHVSCIGRRFFTAEPPRKPMVEYYSALKRKEILTSASTEMNLEDII